jgi:hypothetical protein
MSHRLAGSAALRGANVDEEWRDSSPTISSSWRMGGLGLGLGGAGFRFILMKMTRRLTVVPMAISW